MPAEFSVTDNADGTVTWTVTGTGGASWTAYTATWSNLGTGAWTSNATGTGDSSEDGNLDPGYYFGYVGTGTGGAIGIWKPIWVGMDTAGGTAVAPLYFRVTDGAESIYTQVLDAVVSRIQGLTLTDISTSSIVKRKRPWDRDITKPAIIVSPAPLNRDHKAGNNEFDETQYRCLVTIWSASNQDLTSNLDRHLQWGQDITRAFENQQAISTVDEVTNCVVDPISIVIPDEFARGYDVQTLMVRAHALEGRI